jgi:hypothetical protein
MKLRPSVLMLAVFGCAGGGAQVGPGNLVNPNDHLPDIASFGCDPAQGDVPLTPTCSWQVSDADGDALSCGIDIGADGTTEFPFAQCPSTGSQQLTIRQPGDFQVMLTVRDSQGGLSYSTVQVTGTGGMVVPPNDQAPVITGFTATPTSGLAPLNVEFDFTVYDPDNDPMTCRLLEGSTVVVDSSACGTGEHRNAVFQSGNHHVTLEVKDGRGALVTQSLDITASDAPPPSDVHISKIEWGQTIVSTTPRLVAGKDALLRVYVLGNHAGVTGTVVTVAGTHGSTSVGPLTLTGPSTAPTSEVPSDLSQQWRVTIPGSWIASGLSLTVNAGGQMQTVTPTIGASNVLPITAVPVTQGGRTGSPLDNSQGMKQIWPLKDINVISRAAYTTSHTLGATTNWDVVLQELDSVHQADGSPRDYLGWVRVTYQSGIFGIGYIGEGTALAADNEAMPSVHELGHNMGRSHAPCGGAASPDPNYPVSSAHLDVYGYDYVTQTLQVPSVAYDMMAYCDPRWVSQYNYKAVQTFLEQNPVSTSSAATGGGQPLIIVSGSLRGDQVTLQPLTAIMGPESLSTTGEYTVTVHGNGQSVTVPFNAKPVADLPYELGHFSVLVPDLGAVDGVEIKRNGKPLFKKVATITHVPGVDPKVRVVRAEGGVKLQWNDVEWPFASLSQVNGAAHTTLSLWREGGEAFVSTQGLEAGGAFEVSLSDGIVTKRVVVAR